MVSGHHGSNDRRRQRYFVTTTIFCLIRKRRFGCLNIHCNSVISRSVISRYPIYRAWSVDPNYLYIYNVYICSFFVSGKKDQMIKSLLATNSRNARFFRVVLRHYWQRLTTLFITFCMQGFKRRCTSSPTDIIFHQTVENKEKIFTILLLLI